MNTTNTFFIFSVTQQPKVLVQQQTWTCLCWTNQNPLIPEEETDSGREELLGASSGWFLTVCVCVMESTNVRDGLSFRSDIDAAGSQQMFLFRPGVSEGASPWWFSGSAVDSSVSSAAVLLWRWPEVLCVGRGGVHASTLQVVFGWE